MNGYFYALDITGPFDMRIVEGPFKTETQALIAAQKINKRRKGSFFIDPAFVESWYVIHTDEGHVEGPCLYQRHAEYEAKQNIKEQPGIYSKKCAFTAQVRVRLPRAVVVCKDGETPQEKKAREKKFNAEFDAALEASNRYWAGRGLILK